MLVTDNAKVYEVPETGTFNGTIIDVVELKDVPTQFGKQNQLRIVWVLDKNDSEGNPYRVVSQVNASINEKAKLYELVKGIFGAPPAVPFDSENLMNRSNQLVVVKGLSKKGKPFAEVKVLLPLAAGVVPPKAPANFVRSKDRPAKGTNQAQAASAAPVAQATANPAPAAQPAAQPAAAPSVSTPNAAF